MADNSYLLVLYIYLRYRHITQLNRLLARIARSSRTSALVPSCEWTKPAGEQKAEEIKRAQRYIINVARLFTTSGYVAATSSINNNNYVADYS